MIKSRKCRTDNAMAKNKSVEENNGRQDTTQKTKD